MVNTPNNQVQPPVEPANIPVPAPINKGVASSQKFEEIYKETQKELDEKVNELEKPKTEEVKEELETEEPEVEEEKPESKEEEEESEEEEKPESEEKPAEELESEEKELNAAQELLQLMKDPELLEAALRQAGVETIQELPLFKEIIGRERQSASDTTRYELERAAQEEALVRDIIIKGDATAKDFVEQMDKLSKDIENALANPELEVQLEIPDAATIKKVFEDYANSRLTAWHNQNFLPLSEFLYTLPELQVMDDTQRKFLQEANGLPPTDWLNAHLQVARNNLWTMAQNAVAEQAKETLTNERKVIEAAHKIELEKITKKHERTLKEEHDKTVEATRAEVMAEFASKGTPPKLPPKDNIEPSINDDEITGSNIEEIFESVNRREKRRAANAVSV